MTAALCAALPGQPSRASEELAAAVADAWQRAREAHPTCAVTALELFAFIGERIGEGDPVVELGRRQVADLYLACGCDREDPAALASLETGVLPIVERALGSLKLSKDDRGELIQVLREQMLVARDGKRGIGGYDGRAPLAIWLRVCATRLGLRQAHRDRRAAEVEDAQLDQLAPGVPDPELAYLKRHYGAQFRAAFGEAVASLTPRERNLLRHAVIDGLGIDQIAAIYHIHRATAARQLKQARATLIDGTREHMRLALRVSEAELESILRVIMSMADVTLRQVLARGRGHAQESE
jgi:RNA polymerase sigma-70 factor (ECF subfamily)